MARDETHPVAIEYGRKGEVARFKLVNTDEHELRTFMLALWLILEPTSRRDFIQELAHYHEDPNAVVPPVAAAIVRGYRDSMGPDGTVRG